MLSQENWFNYGAASEKWIPPERRLHARSEYRDMDSKRDVPFHWNPAVNPARVCMQSGRVHAELRLYKNVQKCLYVYVLHVSGAAGPGMIDA